MYAVYKQTHPPTGIEHAIYCSFFNEDEQNLVLAGVNQLQVYRLNVDTETLSNGTTAENSSLPKRKKLECVGSFSLFGNVMSMQRVKLSGSVRDALLLSFHEAKLSLVEYDPDMHDIKTSSLHYFEDSELRHGFADPQCIPIIRVDPDSRCAVMLIYGTQLVVLPFRRDMPTEDAESIMGGSKSSIMSSYIINLRSLDEKITNVLDVQFLHGYFEPTIFILYEPLQTWSGRIAVRMDSCSIVAISLNIQQKVHPIIWSLSSLPYDCFQVIAVPKPIGGVLVFAVNSLLYLNQSVPPYGVSFNSIAEFCSAFPLRQQEGVRVAMDCAQAALIDSDKLVLSLKNGELFVLTLVVDGTRNVRSFHFDKSAASVLTTCMCQCGENYLFLGSRLGNSLLLKYTEKTQDKLDMIQEKEKLAEPPSKKKRLDTAGDWMPSSVSQLDDLDELEVYGKSDVGPGTTITSYVFEVCDSILNIGPCSQIEMSEPAFLSEEFSNNVDPDLELVMTCGYAKNGALCVLQRSIRPQVVTTFELQGCINMWTVYGQLPESEEEEKEEEAVDVDKENAGDEEPTKEVEKPQAIEGGHSFLILSKADSTMVLQTGKEIMELDHSGFHTQSMTVFAGNMGNNKYILQVSTNSIRLLDGVNQQQHIPIDMGSPITDCTIADPYALLLGDEGQVMMITLQEEDGVARMIVSKPSLSQKSRVVTICAYKDVSGMFLTRNLKKDGPVEVPKTPKTPKSLDTSLLNKSSIDDEDDLLYGDTDTSVFAASLNASLKAEASFSKPEPEKPEDVKPTYWAIICRDTGVLEIYTLPEFKLSYFVKSFPMGQKVLVDSGQKGELSMKTSSSIASLSDKPEKKDQSEMPAVKEILLVGLGFKKRRPHLLARVEDDLYIYEAFSCHQSHIDNHLKIRFKKIQHGIILREKKSTRSRKKGEQPQEEEDKSKEKRPPQLHYFDDVSGYSGVFLCGLTPHWLFMTSRGALRIHPMRIDGAITSFAEFHNINCPRGFLYFNKQGEMRISVLPNHLTYDAPWPVRKVPLRCTPHFVAYHVDSKTHAVVTSSLEMLCKLPKIGLEDKEFETVERDDRYVYPTKEQFSLQLFSPVSWEIIPNTRIDLEEWEHVTTMKHVSLKSEGTVSGLKGYIATGTNYCYGEEMPSRGRIIICDVIEVVPEPGQPLTKNRLKVVYDKEQKGPVSALAQTSGFLLSAVGQKLYIWTLKDNDLIGVAFIDTHIYIHQLSTIKNMILAADILKSITLYRFQDQLKVLSIVSRDVKALEVYSIGYLVDNGQLSFLVSDRHKNIIIYTYQPEARESHGGQRLLRRGDFNIGSHVNTMFRILCRTSDPLIDKKMVPVLKLRHISYFATLDGSLGLLVPVFEKVYKRLMMLQNSLVAHIQHAAGLNPKAYRAVRMSHPDLSNPHKNILDGELLWKYPHLSIMEKMEVARRIGTTTDQLLDDLTQLDRCSAHF